MQCDFARSSDARLPRMLAETDVTASLIKSLVPSLANFLKRSIYVVSNKLSNDSIALCEHKDYVYQHSLDQKTQMSFDMNRC